jgi:hypothetical protein
MCNELEKIHQSCGKWLGIHAVGPAAKITAVLIATATVILEFPIWILAALFVCPIAAIAGHKDFAINILRMRYIQIFLDAAFSKAKFSDDAIAKEDQYSSEFENKVIKLDEHENLKNSDNTSLDGFELQLPQLNSNHDSTHVAPKNSQVMSLSGNVLCVRDSSIMRKQFHDIEALDLLLKLSFPSPQFIVRENAFGSESTFLDCNRGLFDFEYRFLEISNRAPFKIIPFHDSRVNGDCHTFITEVTFLIEDKIWKNQNIYMEVNSVFIEVLKAIYMSLNETLLKVQFQNGELLQSSTDHRLMTFFPEQCSNADYFKTLYDGVICPILKKFSLKPPNYTIAMKYLAKIWAFLENSLFLKADHGDFSTGIIPLEFCPQVRSKTPKLTYETAGQAGDFMGLFSNTILQNVPLNGDCNFVNFQHINLINLKCNLVCNAGLKFSMIAITMPLLIIESKKLPFSGSEISKDPNSALDEVIFGFIDHKIWENANWSECSYEKFLLPSIINKFYDECDKNIKVEIQDKGLDKAKEKEVYEFIASNAPLKLYCLYDVTKIIMKNESKNIRIDRSKLISIYVCIFNSFTERVNNEFECSIELLPFPNFISNSSNGKKLKSSDIKVILDQLERGSMRAAITDHDLLYIVHSGKMTNLINDVIGCDVIKIIGSGIVSVVLEVLLDGDKSHCIKKIFSDDLESSSFCIGVASSFFEQQTQKKPLLAERTNLVGMIGALFVKHGGENSYSPTHTTTVCEGENCKYIVMSKCGDTTLYNFRNSKEKIAELAIRSLIHCQFLEMIIGDMDFHAGNCLFDGVRFYLIDAGYSFVPFDILSDDPFDSAAEFFFNCDYLCSQSERSENEQKIKTLFSEKMGEFSKLAFLTEDCNLKKLSYIKCDHIENACCGNDNLRKIQNMQDITEALNNYKTNSLEEKKKEAKCTMSIHTKLPPLTKEFKKMYAAILEDCADIVPKYMQENQFTVKEISAAENRIKTLQRTVNATEIVEGRYLDVISKKSFSLEKTILSEVILNL